MKHQHVHRQFAGMYAQQAANQLCQILRRDPIVEISAHTMQLIQEVNGDPPKRGINKWHLRRALGEAIARVKAALPPREERN